MRDPIELDQEDFYARLLAHPTFFDVKILLQRKGVTDNDVQTALDVFNDRGAGKLGSCIIVLMPSLEPESPNAPGPLYKIVQTVQVIEMPLVSQGDTGSGLSAEVMAGHVRRLFQHFANGFGGTYTFAGMEPVLLEGKIAYGVKFERKAGDAGVARCATPIITASAETAPANITIASGTAGADVYYTTDGSYPSSSNTAALLYNGVFQASGPSTAETVLVRAAAEKPGLLQSNVAQVRLTNTAYAPGPFSSGFSSGFGG